MWNGSTQITHGSSRIIGVLMVATPNRRRKISSALGLGQDGHHNDNGDDGMSKQK